MVAIPRTSKCLYPTFCRTSLRIEYAACSYTLHLCCSIVKDYFDDWVTDPDIPHPMPKITAASPVATMLVGRGRVRHRPTDWSPKRPTADKATAKTMNRGMSASSIRCDRAMPSTKAKSHEPGPGMAL